LRVLETGEMERVGSSRTRRVNVRVLSATNADLEQAVSDGAFRRDLLFRLNTVEIHIPPLRERPKDIPLLAGHFMRRHAAQYHRIISGFSEEARDVLLRHPWPGNVRELDHTVERAVLMAQDATITAGDLELRRTDQASPRLEDLSLEEVERLLIRKALERYDGNVSQAAKALGLSRSGLYRRIAKHEL
jgi:DNA-binding NtrC family response regulator